MGFKTAIGTARTTARTAPLFSVSLEHRAKIYTHFISRLLVHFHRNGEYCLGSRMQVSLQTAICSLNSFCDSSRLSRISADQFFVWSLPIVLIRYVQRFCCNRILE